MESFYHKKHIINFYFRERNIKATFQFYSNKFWMEKIKLKSRENRDSYSIKETIIVCEFISV